MVEALEEQWVRVEATITHTHTHTARPVRLSTTPWEPSSSSWPHYLPLPLCLCSQTLPGERRKERIKSFAKKEKKKPCKATPRLPEHQIKASFKKMRKSSCWSSRYLPNRSSAVAAAATISSAVRWRGAGQAGAPCFLVHPPPPPPRPAPAPPPCTAR